MPPVTEDTAQRMINAMLSMQADVALIKAQQNEINHRIGAAESNRSLFSGKFRSLRRRGL
jgi:hypothetical protein